MGRRSVLAAVAITVVSGVASGVVAGDGASGHSCTKVETAVTVLGDPTCEPHDLATHNCRVVSAVVGTIATCVEVSSRDAPGWGRRTASRG